MRQRLVRPSVTILLLFVSLLLPVAPLLQALESGGEYAHACCRRKGMSCCPRSNREGAGPSFSAGRECGDSCLLGGPVSPLLAAVLKPASSLAHAPGKAKISLRCASTGAGALHFPLLFQRPPPAC